MGRKSRVLVLRENRVIPCAINGHQLGASARICPRWRCFRLPALDEIGDEIATAIERPALAGNILAEGAVKWTIGEFGGAFGCAAIWRMQSPAPPGGSRSIATARSVIRFESRSSFLVSSFARPPSPAPSDIWQDNTWKTIAVEG